METCANTTPEGNPQEIHVSSVNHPNASPVENSTTEGTSEAHHKKAFEPDSEPILKDVHDGDTKLSDELEGKVIDIKINEGTMTLEDETDEALVPNSIETKAMERAEKHECDEKSYHVGTEQGNTASRMEQKQWQEGKEENASQNLEGVNVIVGETDCSHVEKIEERKVKEVIPPATALTDPIPGSSDFDVSEDHKTVTHVSDGDLENVPSSVVLVEEQKTCDVLEENEEFESEQMGSEEDVSEEKVEFEHMGVEEEDSEEGNAELRQLRVDNDDTRASLCSPPVDIIIPKISLFPTMPVTSSQLTIAALAKKRKTKCLQRRSLITQSINFEMTPVVIQLPERKSLSRKAIAASRLKKLVKSKSKGVSSVSKCSKNKREFQSNSSFDTSDTLVPASKRLKKVHFSVDSVEYPADSETKEAATCASSHPDTTAGSCVHVCMLHWHLSLDVHNMYYSPMSKASSWL